MPSQGRPNQHFRIDAEQWHQFGQRVQQLPHTTTRSAVLRQLISWFNREPGAELPERPPAEPSTTNTTSET